MELSNTVDSNFSNAFEVLDETDYDTFSKILRFYLCPFLESIALLSNILIIALTKRGKRLTAGYIYIVSTAATDISLIIICELGLG